MVVDPLIKFMKFSEVARSANEDALTSDLAQQRNLDSGTSSPLSSKLTLKESSRNQQPAYQSFYVSSATPYPLNVSSQQIQFQLNSSLTDVVYFKL